MTDTSSIVMLIAAALFLAGVIPIAWERAPAWRALDGATFRTDLAYTLQRVDKLQPILLLVSLASSLAFAISAAGTPRTLAAAAAFCFTTILIGSGAGLVPIQRKLTNPATNLSDTEITTLRARWLRRHLIRTIIATLAFTLLALATTT